MRRGRGCKGMVIAAALIMTGAVRGDGFNHVNCNHHRPGNHHLSSSLEKHFMTAIRQLRSVSTTA